MKKLIALTFAVAMFAGLSSCSKDYTCTCSYNNGSSDTTQVFVYEGVKKGDAEDACSAAETTYKVIDTNASCTL